MNSARQTRWTSRGALVAATIAGVVGLGISPSSADVAPTSITVSGTNHYVGQTYTVTVHCQVQSTVGIAIDVDPYSAQPSDLLTGAPIAPNADLLATAQWTPNSTGQHTIEAYGCASGVGWPNSRPPTATLVVDVTSAPTSSGSADSVPIIGPLLSMLFN
jgi:hypothetical protein